MRTRFTGLAAWWVQRASAVYMLAFTLFLIGSFWLHPLHSYLQWRSWVASPGIFVAALVFFAALLSHMWVGLRDVLLDYAKPASLRRALLAAVALGLFGLAIWLLFILLRLQT